MPSSTIVVHFFAIASFFDLTPRPNSFSHLTITMERLCECKGRTSQHRGKWVNAVMQTGVDFIQCIPMQCKYTLKNTPWKTECLDSTMFNFAIGHVCGCCCYTRVVWMELAGQLKTSNKPQRRRVFVWKAASLWLIKAEIRDVSLFSSSKM